MGWSGLIALTLLCLAQAGGARTWTNLMGRTFEGEFVRVMGDEVVVLIKGRGEVKVPIVLLSEEDQKFVAAQKTAAPAAEAAPMAGRRPANLADAVKRRVWTDKRGDTISAQWVNVVGDQLQFKIGNQISLVPYLDFCDDDRQLVQDFMHAQGTGLSLPPEKNDLPGMVAREWTDLQRQKAKAILRRFEPGELVVLQFPNQLRKSPFQGFSEEDQEFMRQEAAKARLSHLLPKHPDERTWTDWKGKTFQARLPKSPTLGAIIELIGSEGLLKEKYLTFCEADRSFLRSRAVSLGGSLSSMPEFAEPATPVRTWRRQPPAVETVVEAKFVRLDGLKAILRTATNPAEAIPFQALAGDDAAYIHATLLARGEAHLLPVKEADCVRWEFGPQRSGFTFLGRLVEVKQGRAQFRCPAEINPRGDTLREVAFSCLSGPSQELARTELLAQGKPISAENVPVANTANYRDWKIDGEQFGGWLMYVVGTGIQLGTGQTVTRTTSFDRLSAEDQEYVRLKIAERGIAAFEVPKPVPPGQPDPIVVKEAKEKADAAETDRKWDNWTRGLGIAAAAGVVAFVFRYFFGIKLRA